MVQKLVDKLTIERGPSAANHILRFVRRVFRWVLNRGYCARNPVEGIEAAQERKRQRLPDKQAFERLVAFAQERGNRPSRTGVWIVMELAYLCRLRGIEVITLTDANITDNGLLSNRRKGSRDNITSWNPRLKKAIDQALEERKRIWNRKGTPVPLNDKDKLVVVGTEGNPLKRSSLSSAWQRFIKMAIDEAIISADQRFSLHDLKRRGTTDTVGTKAEKQEATGHRSESMLQVYDKSIPIVKPSSE